MSDQVHSITDAPQKHSDEQHSRMVRYAVSMGIRMVCFILAVILQNWMTWVLLVAAVIVPYVAVTNANVGADRYMGRRQSEDLEAQAMLATAHEEGGPDADQQWWEEEDEPELRNGTSNGVSDSEVIAGELVEPEDEAAQDGLTQPLDDQDTPR